MLYGFSKLSILRKNSKNKLGIKSRQHKGIPYQVKVLLKLGTQTYPKMNENQEMTKLIIILSIPSINIYKLSEGKKPTQLCNLV